jgi:transmembrane 9 superfamily member 2/4
LLLTYSNNDSHQSYKVEINQFCIVNFQDYRWWWRSFVVSGGSAVYVFAYSVFYFATKLEITEFIPTLLYFGYTGIMVLSFWLLTGTIGFFAAYAFIRKIYGAVKID